MTGFDIVVLLVVGMGAISGFLRGFVQEIVSLFAWMIALAAIHLFHTALAAWLLPHVHTTSGSAVLAFALLALIPYFLVRLTAKYLGRASRASLLGPLDRVLGFGFGAVKGTLIVVLVFSVVMLGYDTLSGPSGRPVWLTRSRTYVFVNASSNALVTIIDKRRAEAQGKTSGSDAGDGAASASDSSDGSDT